ncbi:MAG: helix-turn-helix domain-containing protein [Clostridia bacterium]|nr:helix-turn-helix domain-containing protein [Clostridia bacterium]
MYKNKTEDGRNNICGERIRKYRYTMPDHPSQRQFAEMLQIAGLDVDKNAIQRMESGSRFITDIELKTIAHVLQVSYAELLDGEEE